MATAAAAASRRARALRLIQDQVERLGSRFGLPKQEFNLSGGSNDLVQLERLGIFLEKVDFSQEVTLGDWLNDLEVPTIIGAALESIPAMLKTVDSPEQLFALLHRELHSPTPRKKVMSYILDRYLEVINA